jgi:hypothetical protein
MEKLIPLPVTTWVNSTFPEKCETKRDSAVPSIFSGKQLEVFEKLAKFQKQQLLHQKKKKSGLMSWFQLACHQFAFVTLLASRNHVLCFASSTA